MLDLVLGGARSGKSAFAQQLAASARAQVIYVGTAQATDEEMAARIARHQADRPEGWRTVECGDRLDPALLYAADRETVLIDGLGAWLGGTLPVLARLAGVNLATATTIAPAAAAAIEAPIRDAVQRLSAWAGERRGRVIVVSEETGWGIVPASPLSRLFRDVLGRANQHLAAAADHVYLVVAGIPVDLKRLAAEL